MQYRLLRESDITQAVGIMVETRASFAGLASRSIFDALCRDSCKDKRHKMVVLVVAEEGGELAGYVAAAVGGATYWKYFTRRHPLIAAGILLKRAQKCLLRKLRVLRKPKPVPVEGTGKKSFLLPILIDDDGRRSWEDRGQSIAKILHVGVSGRFRGRGVGTELYRCLCTVLVDTGVRRVDASIDKDNIASVCMHHKAGWRIISAKGCFFATVDL